MNRKMFFLISSIGVFMLLLFTYLFYTFPKQNIIIGEDMAGIVINDYFGLKESVVLLDGLNIVNASDTIVLYNIGKKNLSEDIEVRLMNDSIRTVSFLLKYSLIIDSLPVLHKIYGQDYHTKFLLPLVRNDIRSFMRDSIREDYVLANVKLSQEVERFINIDKWQLKFK